MSIFVTKDSSGAMMHRKQHVELRFYERGVTVDIVDTNFCKYDILEDELPNSIHVKRLHLKHHQLKENGLSATKLEEAFTANPEESAKLIETLTSITEPRRIVEYSFAEKQDNGSMGVTVTKGDQDYSSVFCNFGKGYLGHKGVQTAHEIFLGKSYVNNIVLASYLEPSDLRDTVRREVDFGREYPTAQELEKDNGKE